MSDSIYLRIQRVALAAGVKTAIVPPISAQNVSVGNATSGNLEVHTTDANNTEYLVIAAGYERPIPTGKWAFRADLTAFWLKAVNAGTAVMLWY